MYALIFMIYLQDSSLEHSSESFMTWPVTSLMGRGSEVEILPSSSPSAEEEPEKLSVPLQCSLCSYQTDSHTHFRLHVNLHAASDETLLYPGTQSLYPSSDKSSFVNIPGEKTYMSVRTFPCMFCNYVASQRSNLAKHIRIHTGEKPYACQHCAYRCTQKHHLSRHIARQHRGENIQIP